MTMLYRHFVLHVLMIHALYVLFPAGTFFIIYFGGRFHKEEYRGRALAMLGILFGGWFVLNAWAFSPEIYDCVQYLREGDSYVLEDICYLENVSSAIGTVGLVTARNHLYCRDGKDFISEYRRDYPRMLWRWAKEGRVLRVRYLPRSLLVLELNDLGIGH